ncbi:pancreatic secretory granule membrane major glycoprotein GP2-like [Clavelina lepadiformis]|uniref:Uncharacterized protein n=1 Tax=Clavelina lepadiformis TaxID=159417 RepID=A0ABP0F9F7_CLALP
MIYHHYVWITLFLMTTVQQIQGQDDACIGVTCNNKGTCVPNTAYSRGYWCECDDGWAGQDCLHPEPTVQCGEDRIDVVIDKGLVQELEIDDDVRFVYFGRSSASSQCQATEENNLYKLSIQSPFTSCGTQAIQRNPGDDYTFSNTVVWNREVHNTDNLIDRELVLLDFKCIYEDTYTVGPVGPMDPEISVLKVVTENGKFEVRMRLFDDNSFTREHEYSESPTVAIGTYVYVQVELDFAEDSDLVVTMDRCYASQSRDPGDPISTKHMLVVDRCANPNDSTVQVRYNGESTESQFKFQMFKWRWSADDIYLHCEVDICNSANETCTGEGIDCKGLGGFRKKRAAEMEGEYIPSLTPHTGHIISKGPIHVQFGDNLSKNLQSTDQQDVDTPIVALGVILGLILVALGIIAGVHFRKKQQLKSELLREEAETASNKRLTSLHFTTESF